jgi:hypothetical protein
MQCLLKDLLGFGVVFLVDSRVGTLQNQISPARVGAIGLKAGSDPDEEKAQP